VIDQSTSNARRTYIGIGGNVGDVVLSMCQAVQQLGKSDEVDLVDGSNLYQTPPWGDVDQDWFINACFSIETTLTPHLLLDHLKEIERDLNRKKTRRWGPRTIDLDILWMEGVTLREDGLEIPHPRINERAFVVVPFCDIARNDLVINAHPLDHWMKQLDSDKIKKMPANQKWQAIFNS